ncbi:MAG: hypothetical protein ABSC72_10225 [Methylovirgula sp.]
MALSASAAMAASPHAPDGSTVVHQPAKVAVNVARLEEEGDVAVAPETTVIFDRESKNAPRIHWDIVLVG